MYAHKTFIFLFLICIAWAGEENIDHTLTDAALVQRARSLQVARHVVQLEAEVYGLTFRTGSAVCIGDNQFLSNAHCFEPWCDSNGQPKYSLYINAEEKGRKKISNLQIHKLYLKGKVSSKKAYDIAYFSIEDSVQNLEGIEPTYLNPISPDLFGKHLDVIGYGINGYAGSWFGSCDGLKRAIVSPIDSYFGYIPGQIAGIASYFSMKVEYDGTSRKDTVIALKAHQAGFRPGMSGGGVFYDDKYVAISSSHGYYTKRNFILKRLSPFLKGMAAQGIPTPFLHRSIGDQERFLVLGPLKAWIENKRERRKASI